MLQLNKVRSVLSILLSAAILHVSMFAALAADDAAVPAAESYADWKVVGPTGGDVRVVEIDPKDKNHLFISTLDGQIHTSTDGGKSWRLLVSLNKPELILDQLIVDSTDSKKIYTSGHRGNAPGGFFRSTDGGESWKESKELKGESIHSMTQSPVDTKLILLGTTRGVWSSRNSGEDWTKISSSTMPVSSIADARSCPNGFSTTTRDQPGPRRPCLPIARMIGA